jgi:Concanavalin A-like lectin/glucanases superfamily
MASRYWPHVVRTCELAVCLTLIGGAATGCDPIVVDAFEPPPEPVANEPVTCAPGSLKTEPGSCGCNVPDDDFDGDDTPDCLEDCPDNADRIAPSGACGCSSYPDTNTCNELRAAIRNLYTFDGNDNGTAILDTLGDAHGTLLQLGDLSTPLDTVQRNGRLTLDGQGSYVALPERMISNLSDATFEAWVTWRGGDSWARIFDFGDNNGATSYNGVTYLFLTPSRPDNEGVRVAYSVAGPTEETVADGDETLPIRIAPDDNRPDQVAVVVDRTNGSMRLYSNGVEIASTPQPVELGAINDVNNWLGRSNYFVDPALSALFVEFRIYSRALTAAQISASYQAGPGALD